MTLVPDCPMRLLCVHTSLPGSRVASSVKATVHRDFRIGIYEKYRVRETTDEDTTQIAMDTAIRFRLLERTGQSVVDRIDESVRDAVTRAEIPVVRFVDISDCLRGEPQLHLLARRRSRTSFQLVPPVASAWS